MHCQSKYQIAFCIGTPFSHCIWHVQFQHLPSKFEPIIFFRCFNCCIATLQLFIVICLYTTSVDASCNMHIKQYKHISDDTAVKTKQNQNAVQTCNITWTAASKAMPSFSRTKTFSSKILAYLSFLFFLSYSIWHFFNFFFTTCSLK